MLVSAAQFSKTPSAMLVMFAGSVTPVSAAQPEKARSPMLFTLAGMEVLVSAAQSLKAALPMLATPDSITTVLIFSLYADHGTLSSV